MLPMYGKYKTRKLVALVSAAPSGEIPEAVLRICPGYKTRKPHGL